MIKILITLATILSIDYNMSFRFNLLWKFIHCLYILIFTTWLSFLNIAFDVLIGNHYLEHYTKAKLLSIAYIMYGILSIYLIKHANNKNNWLSLLMPLLPILSLILYI